jgi:hypothetical protein
LNWGKTSGNVVGQLKGKNCDFEEEEFSEIEDNGKGWHK